MRRRLALALTLAAVVALPALAQSDDDHSQTTGAATNTEVRQPGTVADTKDLKFLKEAAMSGLLEVRLGELAVKQGASADVKKYGQRLIDDHTKNAEDLDALASQKSVALPPALDDTRQKKMDKLLKLQGRQFDGDFIEQVIKIHEDDIDLYQKEARDGKDPDVKAFAQRQLVSLNDHLKQAKQVKRLIGE